MMALDDKRSIILFKLPACCAKPVTSEVSQTYVIRVPTMVVASGGNICELATTNPFDSERRFRFATLNKTAVKLYEYREASNELVHGAVIFGKAPQQHLNHVAYATEAGHLLMCGKEGRLYDVHGSHVHHSAVLSHQLGCAVSLWKIKGQSYEFLAADTTGTFLLGRFEEDPPAKPRKTRPLGIRPQVAERFTLEQLPAKPGQEFPKGLRPKWRSLAVNERGLVLAASEGHMLVIVDLGLTGQRRCIWRVVQVGHKVEAWALAHHPKIPGLCASGDERGVIHFWDLEQRKPLLEKTYRSDQTVHRLEFSPEGDLLVLGQLGIVTILEFPSLQSVHRRRVSFVKDFRGQEGEVISWIVFSNYADGEDSRYLACACWDQNIYLFRLVWRTKAGHKHKGSERHREIMYRGTLTGNSSSPTHVMFTADAQFLVSNSTDLSILVWRTGTGERLHCLAAVRDMPRAGPWRNIIGWPVAGVWKKSYAQSDVNAVCQSYGSGGQPDGDVLAVADDEHMVNLYRFPAPISLSQGRQYSGHASHVTNVQFSPSNVLVSLGGNDHTLMQWRLERAPAPLQPGRTTCSTPPKRTLPWAKDERPGSAATSAGSGSAGSGSRLNSTGSAEEVLQQLGEREKRRARPPRAPRLAPLHPRGEYTKMTGGYPGFKGPFEGEELRSARPTARSMSEEAPSSGSRPPRPHSTSSLGRDSPHRPSALHQPRLTPAALQCRRLASMRRL